MFECSTGELRGMKRCKDSRMQERQARIADRGLEKKLPESVNRSYSISAQHEHFVTSGIDQLEDRSFLNKRRIYIHTVNPSYHRPEVRMSSRIDTSVFLETCVH